jgi:CO/xanthine dehydrogenase FAD-binding subunit
VRAVAAEAALIGVKLGPELYRRAGDAAAQAVDPPTDIHASADYRRQLTGALVRRALATAASRVRGQA